jgi:hypothetical protein
MKLVLREHKQRAVFATPPTNLCDRLDGVPVERAFHTNVNALIYRVMQAGEDTHARRLSLASSMN